MTRRGSVSVIVPCRDAMSTLGRCLDAIVRSQGVTLDVVVVDDGRNDGIDRLCRARGVHLVRPPLHRGAGAARNEGARACAADILVFVDADVEVGPGALRDLVAPIARGDGDATVGRYSEDVRGQSFAQAYKQLYIAHQYGLGTRGLKHTFWTAIGAVRAACLRAVAGFPEEYEGAGPEDIVFGMRLTADGARIVAVPAATGRHLAPMTLADLARNDLRKGIEDVRAHWAHGVRLSDNRHARRRDIAAVAVASALPASLCASSTRHLTLVVLLVGVWLALRIPLTAHVLRAAGLWMAVRAIPVMYALDLARAVAVLCGTLSYLVRRTPDDRTRSQATAVEGGPHESGSSSVRNAGQRPARDRAALGSGP